VNAHQDEPGANWRTRHRDRHRLEDGNRRNAPLRPYGAPLSRVGSEPPHRHLRIKRTRQAAALAGFGGLF
jgi:hypothetical protein